ncbi:MAG TPA: gamma-glutamyl-gamma-aminobutyrate hydrolase family protein, partial [Leptospiraceae bacterium]|nr:gamma-glutamyl-gamma-aminobutyrate hydrolase family protein [Leptospiraceae bacterium]
MIGITTKPVADEKYGQSFEYVDAIIRAGGIPVLVPPVGNPAEIYERLDGLILSGGGDIDPSYYGGRAHSAIYGVSKERDEFEIELARVAARGRRPCLPICRGIQVLCVALGGTLIEHIPDETDESIVHRDPDMKEGKPHKVDI